MLINLHLLGRQNLVLDCHNPWPGPFGTGHHVENYQVTITGVK